MNTLDFIENKLQEITELKSIYTAGEYQEELDKEYYYYLGYKRGIKGGKISDEMKEFPELWQGFQDAIFDKQLETQ